MGSQTQELARASGTHLQAPNSASEARVQALTNQQINQSLPDGHHLRKLYSCVYIVIGKRLLRDKV